MQYGSSACDACPACIMWVQAHAVWVWYMQCGSGECAMGPVHAMQVRRTHCGSGGCDAGLVHSVGSGACAAGPMSDPPHAPSAPPRPAMGSGAGSPVLRSPQPKGMSHGGPAAPRPAPRSPARGPVGVRGGSDGGGGSATWREREGESGR